MGCDHDHHHGHGHGHAHGPDNRRRVALAFGLTGFFMLAEIAGGLLSGSLALLADAAHMAIDAAALAMAWQAFRLAEKPADDARTYGYARAEILAAFVNGVALIVIVAWILWEAVERLLDPVAVEPLLMGGVAAAGLAVNLVAFALLHGGDRDNLNMRGAALHVLGDLAGSAGAVAAAAMIWGFGWLAADPVLSVLTALLVLKSALLVTRQSAHVLLEGAPRGIDVAEIAAGLEESMGGARVHHVHAWALTPQLPLVTLHLTLAEGQDSDQALARAKAVLVERWGLGHSVIQVERADCPDPEGCA